MNPLFSGGLSPIATESAFLGRLVERLKALVLKTRDPYGSVGSNPTPPVLIERMIYISKIQEITYGIKKIQDILKYINPKKKWDIYYYVSNSVETDFTQQNIKRFHLLSGDEYILIFDGDALLYTINVTADSTLTALEELMLLLSKKF